MRLKNFVIIPVLSILCFADQASMVTDKDIYMAKIFLMNAAKVHRYVYHFSPSQGNRYVWREEISKKDQQDDIADIILVKTDAEGNQLRRITVNGRGVDIAYLYAAKKSKDTPEGYILVNVAKEIGLNVKSVPAELPDDVTIRDYSEKYQ